MIEIIFLYNDRLAKFLDYRFTCFFNVLSIVKIM